MLADYHMENCILIHYFDLTIFEGGYQTLHQLKLLVFQNIINVQQTSFSVLVDIVSVKRAFVMECETAEIILMNKAVSHAFQGDASVLPANFNVTTMYVNLFFLSSLLKRSCSDFLKKNV